LGDTGTQTWRRITGEKGEMGTYLTEGKSIEAAESWKKKGRVEKERPRVNVAAGRLKSSETLRNLFLDR